MLFLTIHNLFLTVKKKQTSWKQIFLFIVIKIILYISSGGSTKDGWLEDYTSVLVHNKSTYLQKKQAVLANKGERWQTKGSIGK